MLYMKVVWRVNPESSYHTHKIFFLCFVSTGDDGCSRDFNGNHSTIHVSQVVLAVKNPPANAGDIRNAHLIPKLGRSPGGGNGNPLQYPCLEDPTARGASGRLQSIGSQRVWHDWSNLAPTHACKSNQYGLHLSYTMLYIKYISIKLEEKKTKIDILIYIDSIILPLEPWQNLRCNWIHLLIILEMEAGPLHSLSQISDINESLACVKFPKNNAVWLPILLPYR